MIRPAALKKAASPLAAILNPRAVAIIGASRDATKRGHQIVRALIDSGYRGAIHPVHPAGGELLGLSVAMNVSDLQPAPDLAVISTPAHTVPQILRECAAAGVQGAVALAVGFGESGESGDALEQELQAIVQETGIRLVGPNTSGLLNTTARLNLIGIRNVPAGPLALLVQSGNLTLQLVTEAAARSDTGFRYCIGVGNETDLQFHEYLAHLGDDDSVGAILMHAEGFRSGTELLRVAPGVSRTKPIVLLKGARSHAGSQVARSHTGAIAGDYKVFQAAMRQAGIIEVTRTDELFHVGQTLASQPVLQSGKAVAILSDGGGHSALAVDAIAGRAQLAQLSPETRQQLRELLGDAAAVENPVDLAGAADADPRGFARAHELLALDPAVGAVLVVGLFGGYAIRFSESLRSAEEQAASMFVASANRTRTGLVVHSLYAASRSAPLRSLTTAGVPVVESLEVACRCMVALAERSALMEYQVPDRVRGVSHAPASEALLAAAVADGRTVLLEPEARDLITAYGVSLVPARWCHSAAETAIAASAFNTPVALKAVSAHAAHKTEAGGVVLDVSPADAEAQYDSLVRVVADYCRRQGKPADVRGVVVAPMQPKPLAELLVGVRRDEQFGPVLVVAAGGSAVEILDQVALRVLPLRDGEIREMLAEVPVSRILSGHRGATSGHLAGVVQTAMALADAMLAHPALESIEVNPLFVYAEHVVAIDARVYLRGDWS
ncbi:MAG: acetate--CoA ligase family protein [Gemmatimonadota bacterium]